MAAAPSSPARPLLSPRTPQPLRLVPQPCRPSCASAPPSPSPRAPSPAASSRAFASRPRAGAADAGKGPRDRSPHGWRGRAARATSTGVERAGGGPPVRRGASAREAAPPVEVCRLLSIPELKRTSTTEVDAVTRFIFLLGTFTSSLQLKPIPLVWHPNFSFSLLPQIQQQGTSSCQHDLTFLINPFLLLEWINNSDSFEH
ncbi:uncharacterized protein [Lolium perenne]|uniref:uncharacterized protein isoform X1 n=1 Tax=Lolium perenne TaxID=4522 RepID=UPI003A98E348